MIRHQFECSLIKLLSLLQLSCAVKRHTLLQSLACLVAAICEVDLDCSSRHPKRFVQMPLQWCIFTRRRQSGSRL